MTKQRSPATLIASSSIGIVAARALRPIMYAMRRPLTLALALAGLFISLYLSWVYASPSRPMLCLGTGCDFVRASSYAHILGVPTPFYGVALYLAIALLVLAESAASEKPRRRWQALLLAAATVGFLVSLGLTGIEAFVLHHWCEWCLSSAAVASLIFLVTAYGVLQRPQPSGPSRREAWVHLGVFLLLAAVGAPLFLHLMHAGELAPPPLLRGPRQRELLVRPDSPTLGNPRARVMVVEFADFECPMCYLAQVNVNRMLAQYGGKIRFVFRQFPLNAVHPWAEKAAEASLCAAAQGKFWQAERLFYQRQYDLTPKALKNYARQLQLQPAAFDACLDSGRMAARVRQDVADGTALGVRGTPTFFINRRALIGPPRYAQLQRLIEQGLSGQSPGSEAQIHPSVGASAPPPPLAPAAGQPPAAQSPASLPSPSGSGFGGNLFANADPLTCNVNEAKLVKPVMIHTPEAKILYQSTARPLFIDVRMASDFARGHIPGAVNIPIEDFAARSARLPRSKTIVLYESGAGVGEDACAFSRAAARILLARGFSPARVKVYQSGLLAWQRAGLPVAK